MEKQAIDHFAFRIAYDGQEFQGFQAQKSGKNIQTKVEKAISILWPKINRIHFGSRTDSGVHAFDQVVIVREALPIWESLRNTQKEQFIASLNFHLGESVRAWELFGLSQTFDFKKDFLWKRYRYCILNSPVPDPLQRNQSLWIRKPLDIQRMRKEMKHLIGLHDFAGFAKSSGRATKLKAKGSIREVLSVKLIRKPHPFIPSAFQIDFEIQARGFLHHMVRNIVGTLIGVGCGKDFRIKKILQEKDRRLAGTNVSPHALCLVETKLSKSQIIPLGGVHSS